MSVYYVMDLEYAITWKAVAQSRESKSTYLIIGAGVQGNEQYTLKIKTMVLEKTN